MSVVLLCGENTFKIEEYLRDACSSCEGTVRKIDGDELMLDELTMLATNMQLFALKQCIVIRQLSHNTLVWNALPDSAVFDSDDSHVILVEDSVDKRSRTYKFLKDANLVHEFSEWTKRDSSTVLSWTLSEIKRRNIECEPKTAEYLIEKVGFGQTNVSNALDKLELVQRIVTTEIIDQIIEVTPEDNVFALIQVSVDGKPGEYQASLKNIQANEDPYRVFGLIASQLGQLMLLASTAKSPREIADETSMHPFVLQKLAPLARRLGRDKLERVLNVATRADMMMKSTSNNPWIGVERVLAELYV